jgi:hypothetical protein
MGRATRRRPTTALAAASEDRTIPAEYAGVLQPNYYCRAWNGKRTKYCRSRAGSKTTHPGVGRCNVHGGLREGDGRVTHGRFSRVRDTVIGALVEQHLADPDPLNLAQELALARATLEDYLHRYDSQATHADVLDQLEVISRIVARIEHGRAAYAISRPELARVLNELARIVSAHVADPAALERIQSEWRHVRI